MPFSVHLDSETRRAIDALAKKTGKTRNSLIHEAVRSYVRGQTKQSWPKEVRDWFAAKPKSSDAKFPTFESYRSEFAEQKEPSL